ncbi:branched-chain amino acid ABC transporter permease [Chitinasiproducens palmae]|uniref:Amino acid/amide ABC transporter membrane protein 1, HAAT family n=1 Tax=Chitinasiproducens palmae TaxID=1770053 RepID=A0A1H2PQB9_9BURK|nr:branched-chain amino acid ABC transporter permease [Chitinasiproducens palmae]SDV49020.1 amino acid/amide ABC transporter membrane protein 1, HAAT family [Chitinasiproducens palmae]
MLFVQLLLNGVALGALYALTAGGFSLIFGATRIFHFAHGAAFMIAGYGFYELYDRLHWPWYAAALLAALVTVVFGVLLDRLVYTPIKRHENSFFTLFAGAFGVGIIVQNLIAFFFGRGFVAISTPLSKGVKLLEGVYVAPLAGLSVVVALLAFGGLSLFLSRSRTGIALRALADSPELVRAYGMSPQRLSQVAFALGSLMVVPAAILSGASAGLNPAVGSHVMLISLAATIVGGVGSLRGAACAGLLLGLAESLALLWFSPQWSEAVVFVVLFLFILFRPSGFFGRVWVH